MTSGAIQKGVPTNVFLLICVSVSCPATPKSASFTSPCSESSTLAAAQHRTAGVTLRAVQAPPCTQLPQETHATWGHQHVLSFPLQPAGQRPRATGTAGAWLQAWGSRLGTPHTSSRALPVFASDDNPKSRATARQASGLWPLASRSQLPPRLSGAGSQGGVAQTRS